MNEIRAVALISLTLFLAGIALLVISVATEEGEIGLFIVFPFIIAEGAIAVLAAVLIFVGIVMMMISFFVAPVIIDEPGPVEDGPTRVKSNKRFGGVVLIGPVPIIFGSDRSTAKGLIILAIALVALAILLYSLLILL